MLEPFRLRLRSAGDRLHHPKEGLFCGPLEPDRSRMIGACVRGNRGFRQRGGFCDPVSQCPVVGAPGINRKPHCQSDQSIALVCAGGIRVVARVSSHVCRRTQPAALIYSENALSTFFLVHGGWHAAWCWSRVVPLLRDAGHCVIAPDLPGHGADTTPLSAKPYQLYVSAALGALASLRQPALLVGHSSGGMILTEVFRRRPESVRGLVYLSAFLLPSGQTPRSLMNLDTESLLPSCLKIDRERQVSIVAPQCAKAVFYGDCTDEDAAWAIGQLQPEPLIPPDERSGEPQQSRPDGHPRRFYIECRKDKALGPAMQRWMSGASPCEAVYSLPTSHSPFISAPRALTEVLLNIDRRLS